jgi:hypothetical protein
MGDARPGSKSLAGPFQNRLQPWRVPHQTAFKASADKALGCATKGPSRMVQNGGQLGNTLGLSRALRIRFTPLEGLVNRRFQRYFYELSPKRVIRCETATAFFSCLWKSPELIPGGCGSSRMKRILTEMVPG